MEMLQWDTTDQVQHWLEKLGRIQHHSPTKVQNDVLPGS